MTNITNKNLFIILVIIYILMPVISSIEIVALFVICGCLLLSSGYARSMNVVFLGMCVLLVVSTLMSYFLQPAQATLDVVWNFQTVLVFSENLKYMCYLLTAFVLFEYITCVFNEDEVVKFKLILAKAFTWLVVLYWIMFILSVVNYETYLQLRNTFFGVDVNVSNSDVLINAGFLSRYSFIFLDPNNCAYCVLAVALYNCIKSPKRWVKFLSIASVISVPIFTGSRGGLLSLLLCVMVFLFSYKGRGRTLALFFIIIASLLLCGTMLVSSDFSFIGNVTIDRLFNLNDSRLSIWCDLFSKFGVPPLVGKGYTLVYAGSCIKPHSDLFRILYSYGILQFVLLIKHVFVGIEIRDSVYIIPIIVGLLLNSIIDEPRLLYVSFMLLAVVRRKRCRL